MDSIEEIAISRIAEILTSNNGMVELEQDIWKKIFCSCGCSESYDQHQYALKMTKYEENWNTCYKHGERSYSAIREVLINYADEDKLFNKFLNEIVSRIRIESVIDYDKINYGTATRMISRNDYEENKNLLMEYANKDFNDLRLNLNLLTLDIDLNQNYPQNLSLSTFTQLGKQEQDNKSLIYSWLETKYPKILDSYKKAIRAYSNSDSAGCLSHCRSVVTGIFSYSKKEQTEWCKGLQEACKRDKNIGNITRLKDINKIVYNAHSTNIQERYQYPRYKTIYQIYSFLSDLGPHITEGDIANGVVEHEETTQQDAFMGLRMTESILIWLYQNRENNL